MTSYQAVFGHVDVSPGTAFASRKEVKAAKLHKEGEAGISWGLDGGGKQAADAIVLSKGYPDDRDLWDEVIYTGVGGQDRSKRQVASQSWEHPGNAGLQRSRITGKEIRVIRGFRGDSTYSPADGYRYDGLYEIVEEWQEVGVHGFQMCRFKLRRLEQDLQELTPLEDQFQGLLKGAAPRRVGTVNRIIRDTAVGRRVKRWYQHTCQICQLSLVVGAGGASYAEGAHIQALGEPSNGPDVDGNVLCLCPNCHIRLDRGAIYLTDNFEVVDRYAEGPVTGKVELATVKEHRIRQRFVQAHRRHWKIEGSTS
ncbi:YDG/SRA domain-containing protein [Streptomyces sp. H27-C3]|uniref:YDG/SRA domain-containing protein n=1 Tax=Streptomyces sp. H27-C3 TaxID=3046305 RepID=UPI0024B9539E|nr:YDG/SRA domain-containing protein [Streptomyces sp. H27-C3]MDJ0461098.1 YDG/SRA domain-containing protein [Streptomyces sp. H27-C3]